MKVGVGCGRFWVYSMAEKQIMLHCPLVMRIPYEKAIKGGNMNG
jgi:hypothetical protein